MKFNKKAMMDDLFDFLFTVIAAFFVLFFVGMVLSGGIAEKEKIALEEVDTISLNNVLLNYLRSPVEGEKSMADLIVSAEDDKGLREKLIEITKELILESNDPLFKGISVKYPSKDIYDPVITPLPGLTSLYSKVEIPGTKGLIEINIYGPEKVTEARERERAATGYRVA